MKLRFVIALFVCARFLEGASFTNGQAARAMMGQYSFTFAGGAPGVQIIGGVGGLAYVNGRLFAADSNYIEASSSFGQNNRVLTFNTGFIQDPHADLSVDKNPANDNTCGLCGYPAINVLGQVDFASVFPGLAQQAPSTSNGSLNLPTAVASDGQHLAVADTNNNRVLIWNSIPIAINAPADLVLGQPDFTTRPSTTAVNSQVLRGPQGVWFQNGKLFVADTGNYRVLIWNTVPTTNNAAADIVLGQPNMNASNQPPVTASNPPATASSLSNPTSVTSDGTHLFVADLGFNRVLIWNSIPTVNAQPADVVVGQPDMVSTFANNSGTLCGSSAVTNASGNSIYPACAKTLNFPRFVLSDGTKLFVADGGNDRVLIYNSIPATNGVAADIVLGQPDFTTNLVTNQGASILSTTVDNTGSVDTVPTPTSLAYDGTNLYVSDATNDRILVFTPGDTPLSTKAILNTASKITRQTGYVSLALATSGSITSGDTVSITIASKAYTYTEKSGDTLTSVVNGLISLINAGSGDANAIALSGSIANTVFLDSRSTNASYDSISLATASSNSANVTVTSSGGYLAGGNAGTAAPGAIVEIDNAAGGLADSTVSADATQNLPRSLAGVQVYMDGLPAPIYYVSPTQVIVQVSYSFSDRNSSSVYVRTVHSDGSITITSATPVIIAAANPGLFGISSAAEPRPAYGALHMPGNPTATVSVDGTAQAGDVLTIKVAGASYTYTVTAADVTNYTNNLNLSTIISGLVTAINNGNDPNVTATVGSAFNRVVLQARLPGAAGSGIAISGSVAAASGKSSTTEIVTAYQSATCCSTTGTGLVTAANPAQPNETIALLATGLGLVANPSGIILVTDGNPYAGTQPNSAANSVSATVGGSTGQVISAGIPNGGVGLYEVQVLIPSTLTANLQTPVYIAQNAFISNTVTIPVGTTGSSATPVNTTLPPFPWADGSAPSTPATNPIATPTAKGQVGPMIWQPSTTYWTRLNANGSEDRQSLGQPGDIPVPGDYDGDGIVDFAVWRPSSATYYVILSSSPSTLLQKQWGQPGDIPVPGDYDGDGRTDYAVWRPSTAVWYLVSSINSTITLALPWGQPGDIPVTGDYDGDKRSDLAVYRPATSQWILRSSIDPAINLTLVWGQAGDIPVVGDFDGDGRFDLSVFRPANGLWLQRLSANPGSPSQTSWGQIGDIPVPGDYDGDGIFDLAVYRPSDGTWRYRPSATPGSPQSIQLGNRLSIPANASYNAALKWKTPQYPINWEPSSGVWTIPSTGNPLELSANLFGQVLGQAGDVPVPGDYDGDGIIDFAVWRPSNATWYVIPSSLPTTVISKQWGAAGDIPVPGDYDGDGKLDYAVWRPSTGQYFLTSSLNPGQTTVQSWGQTGDIPVPGDYDGDRLTDLAVYRPSTGQWILRSSRNTTVSLAVTWGGQLGDIPVPADYDGDGKTDPAYYQPSTGEWVLRSSVNPSISLNVSWGGQAGDIPTPGDYDGDGMADPAFWSPATQTWTIRPSGNPSPAIQDLLGTATSLPANAPNTISIFNQVH